MNALKTARRVAREEEERAFEEKYRLEQEKIANMTEDERKSYLEEKQKERERLAELLAFPALVSNYYGK